MQNRKRNGKVDIPFLTSLTLMVVCLTVPQSVRSEAGYSRSGFGFAGLPSLGYSSDEGLKYGAAAVFYNHGDGGHKPYFYLLQTDIFLMTKSGKKNVFLFFDSPHLIPQGRISSEFQYENDVSSPFYGIGGEAEFQEDFIDESSEKFIDRSYYKFGRQKLKLTSDLQRFVWQKRLRALFGLGLFHTDVDHEGRSLIKSQTPIGIKGGWTNYLKLGLVYDTRDHEPAPNRGAWSEAIVEISNDLLGSDYNFSRLTLTDRRYFSILKGLIYANRVVFETMKGEVPFYEMSPFGSSFRKEEGLGGAKSLRGIRRNRFIGRTKLFANLELRWKLFQFQTVGQDLFLAANFFTDVGRVWEENPDLTLKGFQLARGGGVKIGWNQNFIVAIDVGNSKEVPLALYIGLGYLY